MRDVRARSKPSIERILSGLDRDWFLGVGVTFLGVIVMCSPPRAAEAPEVELCEAVSVQPGIASELVLRGSTLEEVTAVWSSFSAAIEWTPAGTPESPALALRVRAPASTAVGVGGLRIATRAGASRIIPVFLDDLSTASAPFAPAIDAARTISRGSAYSGVIDSPRGVFARFRARRGERWTFEIVAARLGSPLDPLLRVLTPDGRELAFRDDDPGTAPDARLAWTPAESGEYILEIRDATFAADACAYFRLRCGDFPLATSVYPLGARPGDATTLRVVGESGVDAPAIEITVPRDASGHLPLAVSRADGLGSSAVEVWIDELEELTEREPNDLPAAANKTGFPAALNGRLSERGDRDYFSFTVDRPTALAFRVSTRSLGVPTDVALALLDAAGDVLARAVPVADDDGTLRHEFAEPGTYLLLVRQLNREGGPGHAYRVAIDTDSPRFKLTAPRDRAAAQPGEIVEFEIACDRSAGRTSSITLAVEDGEPAGWEIVAASIAEKKETGAFKMRLPADAAPGSLYTFRLSGTPDSVEGSRPSSVSTRPALRKRFPRVLRPTPALDGIFSVSVIGDAGI